MKLDASLHGSAVAAQSVHFLIHPLYSGDPRVMHQSDKALQAHMLEKSVRLARRCKDVAARLPANSAMCMFTHMSRRLLEYRGDEYSKILRGFIEAMKAELGGRLFITHGYRGNISERSYESAYNLVDRVLASGMNVDRKASAYVYGESFGFCVRDSAIVMRDVWAFSNPMRIMVNLTDMRLQWFLLNDSTRDLMLKRNEGQRLCVDEGLPEDLIADQLA